MSTSNEASFLIVCPSCAAVNRVPQARLGDAPVCGKCASPLFSGKPIDMDAEAFARHVDRGDLPVVVDFWAEWCGPCRMMAPAFAQAARELEPHARFGKVDTEAEQQIAMRYAIRSIPTMIVFHRGKEVGRRSGAMSAPDIVQWVRQFTA